MKRNTVLLLLLTSLLALSPGRAEAQLFKKLFGGERQNKKTEKRRTPPAKPAPVKEKPKPNKKPEPFRYPPSDMKARYRVDVLAPLYLDELVKNNKPVYKKELPVKAEAGIGFYEGLRLASDSLTRAGYRMDVYVHDITGPGQDPEMLIKQGLLDESDLLIGLVMSEQIPALANFAKSKQINFVSALSPSDGGVSNNPWFTLLQPSLRSHCEFIREQLAARKDKKRALLYHRKSNPTDDFAWQVLAADSLFSRVHVAADKLPQTGQLFLLLDSTRPNTIVMPVIDPYYAQTLVTQLTTNFPGYAFEIYGLPSWKGSELLRLQDSTGNLVFHITEPFYYDPTTSQQLMGQYKKLFSGKPTEMVFRGYETLFWYGRLLQLYGNRFNEHMAERGMGIYTPFTIRLQYTPDHAPRYNENQHLYLMRYQNGSMQVEVD